MINDKYAELLPNKYKESYNNWINGKQTLAFSSHQPLLIHLLNSINGGKILEFGMGFNSTPLIHIISGLRKCPVLSIETDSKWFDKLIHYKSDWHDMRCINPNKLLGDFFLNEHYSLAFVDGAPAELRQPVLEKIKADYIIVHDSECVVEGKENCYHYNFSMFKHIYHFKTVPPMTTLLSNLDEIEENILKFFK
jgi:hypothetical protein